MPVESIFLCVLWSHWTMMEHSVTERKSEEKIGEENSSGNHAAVIVNEFVCFGF